MAISERRLSELSCPSCDQPLRSQDGGLHCGDCSETVSIVDGVPRFPVTIEEQTTHWFFNVLSSVYETPLWFPVMYRVIGGPFAPLDDRMKIAGLLDGAESEVLDVACGTGRFTRYIADQVAFAWGIDVSDGMLRRARRYANRDGIENVGFARMDATDLRFDDERFDSVACCWALHLFSDIPAALTEIHRVLKAEGQFAGATLADEYILTLPGMEEGLQQTVGAHVFDSEKLREHLRNIGFTTIDFERRGAALFFSAEG